MRWDISVCPTGRSFLRGIFPKSLVWGGPLASILRDISEGKFLGVATPELFAVCMCHFFWRNIESKFTYRLFVCYNSDTILQGANKYEI